MRTENEEKIMMEWLPVYEHDTAETLFIAGYECDKCGHYAYKKYARCPSCKRRYVDPHDEYYE